jgi:hypothetical protein
LIREKQDFATEGTEITEKFKNKPLHNPDTTGAEEGRLLLAVCVLCVLCV